MKEKKPTQRPGEKKTIQTKAQKTATRKPGKTDLFDYLEWRGDLSVLQSPFCEIDSLVLSEVCFIDWEGIVPVCPEDEPVILKDAADRYFAERIPEQMQMGAIVPQQIPFFVRKTADSERFGKICVVGAVNLIDTRQEMQFSATTFLLDDNSIFVAYRGTDDTIVGWKEDLNLSFMDAVPAQKEAVVYLERAAAAFPDRYLRVGGHSKGGNLSIYAASHASSAVQDRILQVYNNDGPGFNAAFFKEDGFLRISDRVINVFPESSVVGMLFEHSGKEIIVKSSATGINQHDGFSWQIIGAKFRTCEKFSADSVRTRRAVSAWMEGITEAECEEFCTVIYSLFTTPRLETLTDFNSRKIALVRSYAALEPEGKKIVRTMLGKLVDEGWNAWLESIGLPKINKKTPSEKKVKKR